MMIVFITQISSAIFAFQFIGKSESIARNSINRLMESYTYGVSEQINWIQRNVRNANFFLTTPAKLGVSKIVCENESVEIL